MRNIAVILAVALGTSSAYAKCSSHFSSFSDAKARAQVIARANPDKNVTIQSRFHIEGQPAKDPCETGRDRHYILIDGNIVSEGNVDGSVG